jgi:RNA polymerase sigma factor (sigma-70 family)
LTEAQLISDCQKGVKSSQYELVKRYSGMLLSICRRYARDESMAKDLLQETLIRVFKNIDKYEARGSFEGWMRTIAINRSLQWIEKSCFRHEMQPLRMPDDKTIEPEVYQNMSADDILELIKELPEGYRAVFNLNIVEGYSHREIGKLLNITEATSRSQLTRARKLLKNQLEQKKKLIQPLKIRS